MAKAQVAVVVIAIILALFHVSCTAAGRSGKIANGDGGNNRGVLTVNGFEKGEEGGGAAECDGRFHSDGDLIVALSTPWYAGGKRCNKKIAITVVGSGRSVEAQVVDECDSNRGCRTNIVDGSRAVWEKLGLNTDVGEVAVTWSDA